MLRPTTAHFRISSFWPVKNQRLEASTNITHLTKWVGCTELVCCRLPHQAPTSDEVGMKENEASGALL